MIGTGYPEVYPVRLLMQICWHLFDVGTRVVVAYLYLESILVIANPFVPTFQWLIL